MFANKILPKFFNSRQQKYSDLAEHSALHLCIAAPQRSSFTSVRFQGSLEYSEHQEQPSPLCKTQEDITSLIKSWLKFESSDHPSIINCLAYSHQQQRYLFFLLERPWKKIITCTLLFKIDFVNDCLGCCNRCASYCLGEVLD